MKSEKCAASLVNLTGNALKFGVLLEAVTRESLLADKAISVLLGRTLVMIDRVA